MEEIKVGDYVRTNSGLIDKIVENITNDNKFPNDAFDYMGEMVAYSAFEIKSHSPNIIDLIEVGDYVNGIKVMSILDGFIEGTMEIKLANKTKIYRNHTEDIKSIVTKEQFSSVEYRLEE